MPERKVHSEGVQIVALGTFAPNELSPSWFRESGIVGDSELLSLKTHFVTPQGSMFELGWLRIEVAPNRLALATQDTQEFERIRDAAISVFRLKDETPLSVLAINRFIHLNMIEDVSRWHRIGDKILPKENWPDLHVAGTLTAHVGGVRTDGFAGQVGVIFQPSNLIYPGIFVELNDHRVLAHAEPLTSREDPRFNQQMTLPSDSKVSERIDFALDILSNDWRGTFDKFDEIVDGVWKLGDK